MELRGAPHQHPLLRLAFLCSPLPGIMSQGDTILLGCDLTPLVSRNDIERLNVSHGAGKIACRGLGRSAAANACGEIGATPDEMPADRGLRGVK